MPRLCKPIAQDDGYSKRQKEYLGDGVYARSSGYGVWLTAENGEEVQNEIFLDPEALDALVRFMKSGMLDPYLIAYKLRDQAGEYYCFLANYANGMGSTTVLSDNKKGCSIIRFPTLESAKRKLLSMETGKDPVTVGLFAVIEYKNCFYEEVYRTKTEPIGGDSGQVPY